MKRLLLLVPVLLVKLVLAQADETSFTFTGYVVNEDAAPVGNVTIINYRTMDETHSGSNGWFSIAVRIGDSIKINHLSYQQQLIRVTVNPNGSTPITLVAEPYDQLKVLAVYQNSNMLRMQRTLTAIEQQLRQKLKDPGYYGHKVDNPYDPSAYGPGAGIGISDIIDLFSKKKTLP
jgi:hypothetical protein